MLIVALVLAAVGFAALVTALVTGNEVLAFVCIAAAAIGVVLMVIDAVRDRHAGTLKSDAEDDTGDAAAEDTPAEGEADASEPDGDVSDAEPEKSDEPEDVGEQKDSTSAVASSATASGAVSLKEAATAAHHPSAEETYDTFDEPDDEADTEHRT